MLRDSVPKKATAIKFRLDKSTTIFVVKFRKFKVQRTEIFVENFR
jgi:hypothetical protein